MLVLPPAELQGPQLCSGALLAIVISHGCAGAADVGLSDVAAKDKRPRTLGSGGGGLLGERSEGLRAWMASALLMWGPAQGMPPAEEQGPAPLAALGHLKLVIQP